MSPTPPFQLVQLRLHWPKPSVPPKVTVGPAPVELRPGEQENSWQATVDYLNRPEGADHSKWREWGLKLPEGAAVPTILKDGKPHPAGEFEPVATDEGTFWLPPWRRRKKKRVWRDIHHLSVDGLVTLVWSHEGVQWRLQVNQEDGDFGPGFATRLRNDLRWLLDQDWQRHLDGGGFVSALEATPTRVEQVVAAAEALDAAVAAVLARPRARLRRVATTGGHGARPRLPAAAHAVAQGLPAHRLPTWGSAAVLDIPANRYLRYELERAATLLEVLADSAEGLYDTALLMQDAVRRQREPRSKNAVIRGLKANYDREVFKLEKLLSRIERTYEPAPHGGGQRLAIWRWMKVYTVDRKAALYDVVDGLKLIHPTSDLLELLRVRQGTDGNQCIWTSMAHVKTRQPLCLKIRLFLGEAGYRLNRENKYERFAAVKHFVVEDSKEEVVDQDPVINEIRWRAAEVKTGRLKLEEFVSTEQLNEIPKLPPERVSQLRALARQLLLRANLLAKAGVSSSPSRPVGTLSSDPRYGRADRARAELTSLLDGAAVSADALERREQSLRLAQDSPLLYESWFGAALLDTLSTISFVELPPWFSPLAETFRGKGNNTTRIRGEVTFEWKGKQVRWELTVWREGSLKPDSWEVVKNGRDGYKRPDYVLELHGLNASGERAGLKGHLVLDAKYKVERGELGAAAIAKELYELFAWKELQGSALPDAEEKDDPISQHIVRLAADPKRKVKNYSHEGQRGVVIVHPNLYRGPITSTPQAWATHSYYGGETVWDWQEHVAKVRPVNAHRPGVLAGAVACRPDHRSDLRRLLEHWLLECIVQNGERVDGPPTREHDSNSRLMPLLRWASKISRLKKGEDRPTRPLLGLKLRCLRCASVLVEDGDFQKERKSHFLLCSDECGEAIELTYCRYCRYSPLIKRSRPDAMIHDALKITRPHKGFTFTNARCPRCESYL